MNFHVLQIRVNVISTHIWSSVTDTTTRETDMKKLRKWIDEGGLAALWLDGIFILFGIGLLAQWISDIIHGCWL